MNQEMYEEMKGTYIQACDSFSYDITRLYLRLEQVFDKYYKKGLAQEGEEFYIPMPLFVTLRLKFYEGATEIYADNVTATNISEGPILSKEDSAKKEYSTLKHWGQLLHYQNMAIGEPCPRELEQALSNMKPGMIVSFTEGRSYICKKNDKFQLVLNRIFDGDIKNIDITKFCEQKEINLSKANPAEFQNFYQRNRKLLSHTTEFSYTFLDKVYIQIKNIEEKVSRFRSLKVQLGPVALIARKSVRGKVRWYSATGKQVSKEQVAYLLGVLNTQPVITTYERQQPTELKTAEDTEFRLSIEKLLDAELYEKAYSELLKYSSRNNTDLTIKTTGILKNEESYSAGSLVFKDGKAFLVSYADASFDEVKEISSLSEKEFSTICSQKYKESFRRIYAYTLREIQELYASKNDTIQENQKRVAERLANDRLRKEHGLVFSKDEIISAPAADSDLIEAMNKTDPYQQFFRR